MYKRIINKIRQYREKIIHTLDYFITPINERIIINSWIKLKNNKVDSNNWGDDINYFLLQNLTNKRIFFFSFLIFPPKKNYLCIGSIIENLTNESSIIWGSGAMYGNKPLSVKPQKVLAVRGPLTRNYLISNGIECPEIYGDPALLLPYYYKPAIEKKFKLGVIPHYVDRYNTYILDLMNREPLKVKMINMKGYKYWQEVIDDICSCEFVISSSLHGLIISDAYNIPNTWVKFSDKISGGHFKYIDYFKSVNRQTLTPIHIDSPIYINGFDMSKWSPISFNPEPLLKCCPFNSKS